MSTKTSTSGFLAWLCILFLINIKLVHAADYEAPRAAVAPTIDGNGNDACWSTAYWYTVDQLWLGAAPSAADFSCRFKVTWDANKLYVLAEITDDVLNDNYTNPLQNYWEDDTWEIFLDENRSRGNHLSNYNAFAYHISRFYDVVDQDIDGNPKLFNSHVSVVRTGSGTNYIWEGAFDVYTDAFVFGATNNPKATLTNGKVMGFAMAYCDNDGGGTRQSFIGSEVITATDKNIAYITADVFGTLTLVNTATPPAPTFSHVLVANGLTNPTVMLCAPDGRIFVCQQAGAIRVIKNGTLLTTPVLTVPADVSGGAYTERGLIGMALDPNFATNNYIYLYYTVAGTPARNRISRFTLNGDVVVAGSELVILDLDPLTSASNHNGGAMNFGLDGKLYVAIGENATPANSQNMNTYHGKILRINSDGTAPTDNPFFSPTASEQRKRIWALGLRNPFTFDIQPGTGKIFVNDVGQDAWEEVNDVTTGGKNLGWPTAEGPSTNPAFSNAFYNYSHTPTTSDSTGCAITGGTFFNPTLTNYPSSYLGKYFFMDYCNNWINYIDPVTAKRRTFSNGVAGAPVAIDFGADGNLYYLSRSNSAVYKIVYSGNTEPVIIDQPDDQTVFTSQPATFTVAVTGSAPFTYQWRKNGIDISGATSATYTITAASLVDAGNYSVYITNIAGNVTSDIAVLTVGPFNTKPVATVLTPVNNSLYRGAETFSYSGTASDAEDGNMPASAFIWYLDFYHDTHVHEGPPMAVGVKSGSFTIPVTGETSDNVWYRIRLVVEDALGLKDTSYTEIFPRKTTLSFATSPAGLKLELDGQPINSPSNILSVQNIERTISPVSPQVMGNVSYKFDSWQHGGASTQLIPTPLTNTSYTANFIPFIPDTTSFNTIADTYVQDGTLNATHATTAYGTTNVNQLVSKIFVNGPNRNVLLRFDISSYTEPIFTASLRLFGGIESTEFNTTDRIPVGVYSSTNITWNEATATWNTRPTISNTLIDTVVVTNSNLSPRWYNWDVSDYIKQAKAAGNNVLTLVLVNTQDLFPRVIFNSKENIANTPPQLVITKAPTVLSTNLLQFDAKLLNDEVRLDWLVTEQFNTNSFIIEKSYNNVDFVKIGEVKVESVTGNVTSYSFSDKDIRTGTIYYRLKQIGFAGEPSLSQTVEITNDLSKLVFPNPSNDSFSLIFYSSATTVVKANVKDLSGKIIDSFTFNTNENFNFGKDLSSGMYILEIQKNGENTNVKILKR